MVQRYVWAVIGVSCTLASCGREAPSADPPAVTSRASVAPSIEAPDLRPRVVVLGTSLTAGYGVGAEVAWPALLQEKIDAAGLAFQVVNAGVSGETSAGAVRRLDWVLEQGTPAVLVIETGANDGLRGQDVDSLRANLETIIARARTRTPPPLILLAGMEALPNLGPEYARRFREVYPDVARRTGVAFLPFLLEGVGGVDALNQEDGIHPNRAGHARVADHVWTALQPLLERTSRTGSAR